MDRLQIGIIGCGAIAKLRHIPECRENENVSIFGVCDINEERAQKFAKAYRTTAYTDYKQMLGHPELDAVIICLPHHLHAVVAIDCAEAGKHVLVEKPIATNIADAERMVDAADTHGVKLMVAHNQRFVPSHIKAKEWLDSGKLGNIYSFKSTFGHSGPEQWSIDGEDCFYIQSPNEVFGVLGDLAIHKVDLMQYLLDSKVIDVQAITGSIARTNTRLEDNAILAVRMENGVLGSITASWSYLEPDFSTTIYCEHGLILIEDDSTYPLIIKQKDGTSLHYKMPDILTYERTMPGRSQVVASFVQSILQDEASPISGKAGIDALAIVLKAMKSNRAESISIS